MGRHGENIRRRKSDGRWEGRYKVYHEEKKEYVYRSVYGHTYDEVKEKLFTEKLTAKNTLSGRTIRINSAGSFAQVADEWLEHIRKRCKYSTFIKYSTVYRAHIVNFLGSAPLTDITDVRLRSEIPEHLSDSTKKSIYCVVNQILRYTNIHYSTKLPAVKRTASQTEKKSIVPLSVSEQQKLFNCLHTDVDKYKVAISFSLRLGLRLGEICALKWIDVDAANQTMTISHTVQRISIADTTAETARTNLLESAPKSGCSRRIIPISCELLSMLDSIQNGQPYIFGGKKPLEPRTMQYQFKRVLREAAIASKNFHILRHTFATNCVEKGIDVKSLSEILGHSDVKITLNRYVHPTMEAKRTQLEQLTRFYDQIHEQAQ